ncbi:MAG TPA: ASKHA domain-containing protein [Candidatus Hydrogenedentes bacterium]|nr:ASKHA domain-containing protein [Candidatus Hydrogenedentota bacterium]
MPGPDDTRLLGDERVKQGWRLLCGMRKGLGQGKSAEVTGGKGEALDLVQIVDGCLLAPEFQEKVATSGVKNWALAVDLGTTTVAGALVPLDGPAVDKVAGEIPPMYPEAVVNAQRDVGGLDVMSRIAGASESPEAFRVLRERLLDTVGLLARQLLKRYGVDPQAVKRVVLCGNTTMTYFFLGRDVSCLGQYPFLPEDTGPFEVTGSFPGLPGKIRQWLFPTPGGFIGGDIVAGLLVTRRIAPEQRVLFMDLGTNGELVAREGDVYIAAGTAAGPAFEGARITCGSPAVKGAIESVRLSRTGLSVGVIGGGRGRSLCGSGLVDLVAGLLRTGGLVPDGQLRDPEDPAVKRVPVLAKRMYVDASTGETRFHVAGKRGGGVWLSQRDAREFQLAVAAIRSGSRLLCTRLGGSYASPDVVIMAGGYGFHLDVASAVTVGLVPPGVSPQQVVRPGNTALAGAAVVARDPGMAGIAERLAARCAVINLADLPGFAEVFVDSMTFPVSWDQGKE